MWGKIVSSVSNALDFNQATLSGCIDIICIESEIESEIKNDKKINLIYKSTPFHVRFGKTKLLRSKEKIVNILVNGKTTNLHMKLGSAGEAYFVEKTYDDVEEDLETSPLSSPRYQYDDIFLENNIDSCSIYESSVNNFKSDKEEYEFYANEDENKLLLNNSQNKNTNIFDKNNPYDEIPKNKSKSILERKVNSDNEIIPRSCTRNRRSSKASYKNDNIKSHKKKSETKIDLKHSDKLSIKEIQITSQENTENKKKSIISNNDERDTNEDGDILYNLKTYQTIKKKNEKKNEKKSDLKQSPNEYDDKNNNSEWSWSWGRLPHLKVPNQASDNGSIILSSSKKKKKNRSVAPNNKFNTDNNKNKELKNEHLLSIPNDLNVRKRNFSECYVKKSNDHNIDIKKYSLAYINKEKNINFIAKDSKSKNIINDAFVAASKNNNMEKNMDKNMEKNIEKNMEKNMDKNMDKNMEKNMEKNMDKNMEKKNRNSINIIHKNPPNNLEPQRTSQSKSTRPLSPNYNTKRSGEKKESNLNPHPTGPPTVPPTESTKNMFESKVLKKKEEKKQSNDNGPISDDYIDEENKSNFENNYYDHSIDDTQEHVFDDDIQNRIECSLCGHLLLNQNIDNENNEYNIEIYNKNIFEANIVTYDQIDRNSNLWYHPSLVFRFDKKDPYYPSRVALPLLASWIVFNQPLSIVAVEKLLNSSLNLIEMKDKSWRNWFGVSNVENNNQIKSKNSKNEKQNSTLTYKKKNIPNSENNTNNIPLEKDAPHVTSASQSNRENRENNNVKNGGQNGGQNSGKNSGKNSGQNSGQNGGQNGGEQNSGLDIVPNSYNAINLRNSSVSHENNFLNFNKSNIKRSVQESLYSKNDDSKRSIRHKDDKIKIRYRKSLRPTSEQLQSLNLKEGANTITFLVTSSLQGTKSINGTIYLWKKNAKIVISDVDGTITRSNVLGHIMPIVGKDWSHDGVSQLFNKINNNGYHILYLTARAIGQADSTREYLFRFKRNDNKLPDGPLILSPDRLFPSFKREVIDKKPYIFKIAALRDIRNLFPLNHNPFYAAFGNTESDHRAYISVGVPEAKVFIIDNHGIVHHVNSTYAKTYETMSEITEYMFPSIKCDTKREDDDQYNSFQYWKMNSLTYYEKYMDISDSS